MSAREQSSTSAAGLSLATTTGFIVAAVIILLILFVFAFFLCLRVKGYWGAYPVPGRDHVFPAEPAAAVPQRRGLDAAAIKALPSIAFRSEDFKEGAECAVCLGELSEGEAARLLPTCNHAFHLECIDMWFYSHSTCPLCRSPMALGASKAADSRGEPVPGNVQSVEPSPNSPASVLLSSFHVQASVGDVRSQEGSSSRRPEEALVVEILPRRAVDGFRASSSPLFASRLRGEEVRSATAAALSSLRRLLGSRVVGASSSPRVRDIEQGCTLPAPKSRTSS